MNIDKHRFLFIIALVIGLSAAPISAQAAAFDLQSALTNAQAGATIVVPAGLYAGPLQIDRAVVLEGQAGAIIQGTGQGDVLTIRAANVTIRGFAIRHSGDSLDQENAGITVLAAHATIADNRVEDALFGIYLKNAPNSVIRNNVVLAKDLPEARRGNGIRVWYSEGTLLEGNTVQGTRDVIVWFSSNSIVRNNTIEQSRYGIHTMSSNNLLLESNILRHNSVGIYTMYGKDVTLRNNLIYDNRGSSGYGVGMKDVEAAVLTGNRFVSNRVGIYLDNSPRAAGITLQVDHNLFAYNEIGVTLQPLVTRHRFAQNIFQENGEQVALAAEGTLHGNLWSQDGAGNYWSDYAGFDADGNQIGDLPYRAQSLFEDLLEKYPELRLFQLSPATDALDLAAKAFPIFQPHPKLADDYPLMVPPTLPVVPGLPTSPWLNNLVIATGMLTLALLILTVGANPLNHALSTLRHKLDSETVKQ
jgi:nitrous oxidase accessory protein